MKLSEKQQAINFGKQYKSARERLNAIMQNIVRNKGEFVPAQALTTNK